MDPGNIVATHGLWAFIPAWLPKLLILWLSVLLVGTFIGPAILEWSTAQVERKMDMIEERCGDELNEAERLAMVRAQKTIQEAREEAVRQSWSWSWGARDRMAQARCRHV
ncbi:hypothetical protein C8R43DRAFT_995280 [Mycena crocata]|nr:hypothetical protein C8R43DRAFT_995280 [Mycena crocata]